MGIYDSLISDCLHQAPYSYSILDLVEKYGFTYDAVKSAIRRYNLNPKTKHEILIRPDKRTRLLPSQNTVKQRSKRKIDATNVLVVGDLHEPFCLDEYLDFCQKLYKKYNCTHVIFIGDIIDNHFTSYHDVEADGFSAFDELQAAISRVGRWVESFPQADVTIGNHDRLIARKARTSGISALWLRQYSDVLNAPDWKFVEEIEYDGVRYIHGEGGSARNRVKKDLISTVQGHRHAEGYVEWLVGHRFRAFGMQVGCGVDNKSYAMAYAKAGPKPVISAGVVLDHGTQAIIELMKL